MKKPVLTAHFVAAFALLVTSQARAWGPLEHKVIAKIAQDSLSPEARRAVVEILGPGNGLDKVANCADDMLYTKGEFDCGGVFSFPADPEKKTRPWHYIDMPIGASPTVGTVMDYCPNGKDCVVGQVRLQSRALGDPSSSLAQKQVALMYLVHFVGDEHQPFHCADDADYGGNKKGVVLKGTKKNLHSLWDDLIMVEDWRQQTKMDPAPFIAELEAEIARWDTLGWTEDDFVTGAAMESFEYAKNIYKQYGNDLGQDLSDEYQEPAWVIAKLRMQMAGVRLAAVLEKTLVRKAVAPSRASRLPEEIENIRSLVERASTVKFE